MIVIVLLMIGFGPRFMQLGSLAENILDSRLIEQFEQRLNSEGSVSNMGSGSSSATDPLVHKRGHKPKAWKEKHLHPERDSLKKKETDAKKEKKPPSFLMQTASGRMPKVASRFEASVDPARNKGSNKTEESSHAHGRRKSSETFEKSMVKLEKDLEKLPESRQRVMRCETVVKKEVLKKEEDEEEDEEEAEDRYELTEWPLPDSWPYLQKVFVTDVTVDNVTVTMRECKTPEGFFSQPIS